MLHRILDPGQADLLSSERDQLRDLLAALERFGAVREDTRELARSIRQLDELFLLVVVGEFNAGKSTFINALLGMRILAEGVTPTTSRIHRLRHGDPIERTTGAGGIEEISAPVEILHEVQIVDTPGTNALDRDHEALTQEFVPRSDLVLFVTSADRPFTESERAFIQRLKEWGKKIVFVVNKVDFLSSEEEIAQVEGFIADNAHSLLDIRPEIFSVSSRMALDAKIQGGERSDEDRSAALERSRFPSLEQYLVSTLDETERVRLKLLNPLGVGRHFAARYIDVAEGRAELLRDDLSTLEDIERQVDLYQEDMSREFRFRLTDVENILHEFERRGQEFFDETLRLTRALDLLNKAKVKADFERKVIADAPRQIEYKVEQIIDWMVASELKQWQAISRRLGERAGKHSDRMIGELASFDYDRGRLLETVGRAAQRTVESYDRERESSRMAESVQTAVAGTALIEVGALSLGAIISMMATTQLADFTGLLAAGTMAVLGLFVLPARRRKAQKELSRKILDLRNQLMRSLTEQFDREIESSRHRIDEAIAPYTRFVRAERERLEEMRRTLEQSSESLEALETKISASE